MLTGLEAVGAASACIQLISFAITLTEGCKKVYDGRPTRYDRLEEHAGEMVGAADRVRDYCNTMTSHDLSKIEVKLKGLAEKCSESAKALEQEAKHVTSLQEKGKLLKSIHATLRASHHRKKIANLEQSFSMYRDVMETELLSHICSKLDAINIQASVTFKDLNDDVKRLINGLAQGFTKLEDLVKTEHETTRSIVMREAAKTQQVFTERLAAKNRTQNVKAEEETVITTFIASLKFPEMNERYSNLLSSSEASFESVFISYKDVFSIQNKSQEDTNAPDGSRMSEIDRLWVTFVDWLEHGHSLFAIQGKPGSGKSTLFKFLANHENTEQLILRWRPNATILTHFFWKIGTSAQNSIKGLYQTLIHKILSTNRYMVKQILDQLPRLASHNSPHDWSVENLKQVLLFILKKNLPMCIFIDGLDEIGNHDGLSRLTHAIDDMLRFPNLKICVASRPEILVVNWLSKRQAPSLLLEDLTRSDMTAFVHGEFSTLTKSVSLSEKFVQRLTTDLVSKAQGVFLWLHLATRNVASGIEKGDSEKMLLSRLDAMPPELNELYAGMWQRLNENDPVYRETAARLFQYVLQNRQDFIPRFPKDFRYSALFDIQRRTLFQIACAENIDTDNFFFQVGRPTDRDEVLQLCDAFRNILQIRCAGLVRIDSLFAERSLKNAIRDNAEAGHKIEGDMKAISEAVLSRVDFIHRTAHDFLMDTEAGQEILKHSGMSSRASRLRLLKGQVCLLRFLRSEYGIMSPCADIIYKTIELFQTAGDAEEKHRILDFLQSQQKFYDEQIFGEPPEWQIQPSFFTHLTFCTELEDFVLSKVAQSGSKVLATDILRDCWDPDISLRYTLGGSPSAKLVEGLISLGGDPHAYGLNRARRTVRMGPFALQGTAFSNFLNAGMSLMYDEIHLDGPGAREMCKVALMMAATCPNMKSSTLLHVDVDGTRHDEVYIYSIAGLGRRLIIGSSSLIFEADFGFLLSRMFSRLAKAIDIESIEGTKYDRVSSSLKNTSVKVRLISSQKESHTSPVCYQILSGISSVYEVDAITECAFQFDPPSQSELAKRINKCLELAHDNPSVRPVDIEAAIISLSKEKKGFCTLLEAQILPPLSFIEDLGGNLEKYSWPLTPWPLTPWPLTISELRKEVVQHSEKAESDSIED